MSKLISLILTISLLITTGAFAASKQQCKKKCKGERNAYIRQCMVDESEYWDGITSNELVRHCKFLTYFEYLECVDECVNPNKRAKEFYDKNVKNFPEVEQMNDIIKLPEGTLLPEISPGVGKKILKTVGVIAKVIIIVIFYFLPSFVIGEAARSRGYEKWWLFTLFAILFTPLLGVLVVIAFPAKVNYIKLIR